MAHPGSRLGRLLATLCVGLLVAGLDLLAAFLASGWQRPELASLVREASAAGLAGALAFAGADLFLIQRLAQRHRATAARCVGGALVGLAGTPALAAFLASGEPGPLSLTQLLLPTLAAALAAALAQASERFSARASAAALCALPLLLLLALLALWLQRFERTTLAISALLLLGAAGLAAGPWILVVGRGTHFRPTRPTALLLLLALPWLAAWWPSRHALPAELPTERHAVRRVVLLVVDTLRADALAFASSTAAPTPAIDALAREGVVFSAAHANSPWTLPSMVSLLSGTPPETHGMLRETLRVPRQLPLLAEQMRLAGYRTAGLCRNPVLQRHVGLDRGLDEFLCDGPPPLRTPLGGALLARARHDPKERIESDRELTELALEWIGEHADEDFFLWLQYYDPHTPYEPPADLLPAEPAPPGMGARFLHMGAVRQGALVLDAGERDWIRALYAAEVRETDRRIGELVEGLRARGLLEDTLIVLTSDHGEEFWEHGSVEHGHTLYGELLRVPLLVRLPAGAGAGRVVEHPVLISQVPRTIFEICGLPSEGGLWAGEPLLASDGSPGPAPQVIGCTGLLNFDERTALLYDRFKYIQHHVDGREEVYDLAADPRELEPLSHTDPRRAPLVQRGRELLGARRAEALALKERLGIQAPQEAQLSSASRRMLQQLGYAK